MSDAVYLERPVAPMLRRDAFVGVRRRRIGALLVDLTIVSTIVAVLWAVLIISTLGLALLFLPPLFPFVAFFYNGFSVSGRNMATPGMRLMDLEVRTEATGARVPFLLAATHALMFYVTWMFSGLPLLTSLFDGEKRCLHDVLSGVLIVRRL